MRSLLEYENLQAMARTFLLAFAHERQAAERAVATAERQPDLIITSPSTAALMRSADDLERALPRP
jgi:hypothetical protein